MKKIGLCLVLLWFPLGIHAQTRVSELHIEGAKRLKTAFVKKISNITPGAVLDSLVLDQDIIRLKRLPAVSHAYYTVRPEKDNNCTVTYTIVENFTIIPVVNVYRTIQDKIAFRLGVYEYNALGRNITVGGFYQHDIYHSIGLNFRAPYLFSNRLGVAINYQNKTTLEPVFFDNTTANYKYNNHAIEIIGLYELDFNHRFELGGSYFTEDYDYISGAKSPQVPQALNTKKWLAKFLYEYNDLDYFYYYISGFKSQLNVQYVEEIKDQKTSEIPSNFIIAWNDFLWYKRLGKKGNWANRLRLGLSKNDDTPFAAFAIDNNRNIRGVGNTVDRGTGTVVLNTEYRYTAIEKDWFVLQTNLFVDAGTWRHAGEPLKDFFKQENIRLYPGVGCRFIHKRIYNAVFRIDYGFGITKNGSNGIVFGIGQYF